MFFIRHKAREEKSMKRVKMLLVAMLCVVMAFGAASVPVSAEVIEVEKPVPVKPKEISAELSFSKRVYHLNEKVILNLKLKDFPEEDIKKIDKITVGDDEFTCEFTSDDYDYNSNQFSVIKFDGTSTPLEKGKITITNAVCLVTAKQGEDLSKYFFICDTEKPISAIFYDNCADNIHTVYKDNWKTTKKATCTEDGLEVRRCIICGQIADSRIIPKKGHEPGELYVCQQPTYDEEGEKWIICNKCNMLLYSEKIPKLQRPQQNTKQPNKIITTSKLKFKKKSITIKKGKSIKLKYTRKPVNAQDTLSWKSSKPKVVKILKNGKVKGIKKGKSVITLKTSTGKKAKITIKVK